MGGLCLLSGLILVATRLRHPSGVDAPPPKAPASPAPRPAGDSAAQALVPVAPKIVRQTPLENNYQDRVPPLRDPNFRRQMNGGTNALSRNYTRDAARFTSMDAELAVALHEVRIGGKAVPVVPAVEPRLADEDVDEVVYPRGAVTEKYALRGGAVEQIFVLDKSLESLRGGGELALSVALNTTLTPTLNHKEAATGPESPTDRVEFRTSEGRTAFTYGGAVAIDATGRRRALSYALGEGRLEMTLDAAFLASAEFPLTIDPLIGSWFYVNGTSDVHQEVDVAFSPFTNVYLVVFERNAGSGNGDIQCASVDVNGAVLGQLDIDVATGNDSRRPRVCRGGPSGEYMVVWHEKSGSQYNIMGQRVKINTVAPFNPLLVGTKFTVVTFAGGKDSINPTVGWSTTKNQYLVAYELVFSSSDHDIYCRGVSSTGVLLTNVAVDASVAWDEKPSVTPICGDVAGLAWTKRPTGPPPAPGDIYACGVDVGGPTVGVIAAVSTISNDEMDVRLGSNEGIPYAYACWTRQFSTIDYDTWCVKLTFPAGAPTPPVPVAGSLFVPEGSSPESMRPACAIANRGGKERLIVTVGVNPTHPPTPGSSDIIGLVYDTSTDPPTFIETISVSTQSYEDQRPSVAINPADLKGLVVWDHAFSGTTDLDPLGQRVDLLNPGFAFSPTTPTITTTEGGGIGTFSVRLKSKPTASVGFSVASSNTLEGTVSVSSLIFTPLNWNIPQTVTVTGVNDSATDGNVSYTIVLGTTSSGDPDYNGLDVPDVPAVNNDNEPEVRIFALSSAAEPATTGNFQLTRTGSTLGILTVNLSVSGSATPGTDYSTLPASVTFGVGQGSIVLPVNPINDVVAEGTETVQVTITAGAYTVMIGSATMNINDDDVADFAITPISGNTDENGGTAFFRIHLTSQPAGGASVTIPLASNVTSEGVVSPASVSFNASDWNVDKVVTVAGVNDLITDGPKSYQIILGPTSSGDPFYNNRTPNPVDVINDDNEPEVSIFATIPNAAEPATNGQFTVTRSGSTASALTVFYVTGGSATAGSDYSALSGSVTIPAGSSSATIPLTVIDDFIVEPSETVDVTLSVGPGTYTVVLPWAASATIADNDVASFQVSAISGHTTESGGPATFTVRLTSVPSAQVSIALASNNTAEGTVSPSGLTFDSGDWNVPKTVTVTGVNDSVTDGNKLYQITLGPAVSGDPNYSGKPITPVDVINDDNEPEVTIVATTPNASEPSTNGVFTVTRTGSLAGTLTVNYTVSGTATPGADYNAMTGTLNFPATLASQTIIVPVINDSIVEPAETVIVTISPSANYTVASPSQATVTISDDDVAGFVVSGISGHTDENLGTATFTVRLTSQPSANVQVTATTSLTSEGLVSSAAFPSPASSVTLTFTSLNWNSNQVVTVTGQNDNVTDPSHLYQINLGPAVSGDGNYSGKTLSPVAVINDDNEPEVSVAVTTMAAEPSTNGVFTLSRTGNNGASLTVNYTMGGSATAGTDYTTPSGSATFAPGASTTTVIIGVINDSIVEGLKTINLFLSASANYTIGSPSGGIMTLTDDDTAGVVVSAISGHTTEGGGTATFTVKLSSQPTADVTIPLASNNLAEGTVAPSSLTFNSVDWNTPKTVTVTGVNDFNTDGNQGYQINLGPATSGDFNYGSLIIAPVNVINDDNEPEVSISATTPAAAEPSTNGVFTVSRTGSTAASLTVNYTVGGSATAGSDYATLSGSVTIPAGQPSATITVAVINDSIAEGPETVIVTLTAAPLVYTVVIPTQATVTITDNDTSGFVVSAISGHTTENGGTATFTVKLNSQPAGGATVNIPVLSSNSLEGTVSPTSLTFNDVDWNTPKTVTVTGVNDFNTDGNQGYQINLGPSTSGDPNYSGKPVPSVAVVNDDNEPEVTIAATTPTAFEGGASGVFTVTRTGLLTGSLTVNYSVGGTATAGADYTTLPGVVVIPAGSPSATFSVNVVDDFIVEPAETVIATLTAGSYTVRTPNTATVTITDNDTAGFIVSGISGHTTEGGGTATFTVKLSSQPSVSVSIAVASDTSAEGTASPTSLTFTNADWDTPKTVTVTGVNDSVTDGNQLYHITLGPASSFDPNYSGKTITPVDVINDDNEPEVRITATTPAAAEPNINGVFTVTRTGLTTGSLAVNYTISGTASAGTDYTALSGTVTIPVGQLSTTITVAVLNDSVVEGPETVIATLTPAPGVYTVMTPSQATVTITDDDVAGFNVSLISGHTTEGGGTATFTVSLTSQPSADVTVSVSSSNTAEGTVSPLSLTFTNGNWSGTQTVTVTGVNDTATDGNVGYRVDLGAATSTDPNYTGKVPAFVNVINDDNEPEVRITATTPAAAEPSTNGVFTVTRTGDTTSALTVNYTIGGSATAGSDYTALPGSVVIPIGAPSVTITVAVINDPLVESPETVIATLTPAPGVYTVMTPSQATVTIADDDVAGFNVSLISGHTTEGGGTATFTVSLTSQPAGAAIVTIALGSSNTAEGTVSPASLSFDSGDWNVPKLVTVTGVNDTLTDGNKAYQITLGPAVSSDPNYSGKTILPVGVVNDDNEPEVRITATTPAAAEPSTNGVFTVTRTGDTTSALTVNYTIGGSATAGSDYTALPGSVVIPAGSLSVTIPVTVIDDLVAEAAETVVVTLAPGSYTVMVPNTATVTITDNDTAGFTVSGISGHTTEGGGTATFTVRLTSQPLADVTIPVTTSNTGEGLVSSAAFPIAGQTLNLTFTASNWFQDQTVTVTGVNDFATDGNVGYFINLNPTSSGDPNYNNKAPGPVPVTNDDNEPEVSISATSPNAAEPNVNGVFTVSRTGLLGAALVVNYTVSGTATPGAAAGGGADYQTLSGTVTILAGNSTATINVNVFDDFVVEAAETVQVTLTPAAPTYFVVLPSFATVTIADNDAAGFNVSGISGHTTEGGQTATFTVSLKSEPTGNVTIPLSSSDTTEGTVAPSSLTFTPLNWNINQTVTVTGVNDSLTDGNITYQIDLGPTTSVDGNYQAKTPPAVVVINDDNEPEVTIVANLPNAAEPATNGQFTVTRTGSNAAPLTVNYTVSGTATPGLVAGGTADYQTLSGSVIIPGGADSATIDVTVFDDITNETPETVIVTLSPGGASYTRTVPFVGTVTIADDDQAGFTVSLISGNTTESGGSATFTVVLNTTPSDNVTIPVLSNNVAEGLVSSLGSPIPGANLTLTFTPGNARTPQTVTVTGVNDFATDGNVAYTIKVGPTSSATDPSYDALPFVNVAAVNVDNEPEVSISATTPNAAEPNVNGAFTVSRTGDNTSPLVVNYTVGGTATAGSDYAALSGSVTIPAGSDFIVIPVTVINDASVELAETVIATLTPSVVYTVTTFNAATVTIADDDTAGFNISPISGHTTEGGGTATFTVSLTSQPSGLVTIAVASDTSAEGTASPSGLSFNSLDWNIPKTVTVTGVNDAVTDGNKPYQITLGPAVSGDSHYSGMLIPAVGVINDDNEPEVRITATTPAAAEPATNGVFTVTRTGDTTASLTVNYTVAGSATAGSDYTALSGTVTILAGAASAPITVAVINDPIVEGPEDVIVTLTPAPLVYTVMIPSQATVTITDNDTAGFNVSGISGHTTEGGGTATFTVSLTSQPSADVTISVASSDTAEGTASPSSLTFTSGNWNVAQPVTVTGVNDAVTDGNVGYRVDLGAATSTDPNYTGKVPAFVNVINDDNEPEVRITATTPAAAEPNINGVFTVTRTGLTTGPLDVNYTVGGTASPGTDYTALSGTVTIPAGSASATITVAVINDQVVELPETVVVTLTAAPLVYTVMSPSQATVTITDDDVAGFNVSLISGHTTEGGGTATFTVSLTSQPAGAAIVTIALGSSNTAEGTVSPASLSFDSGDWNVPKLVTVTGVNDTLTDGNKAYQITLGPAVSGDANYSGKTITPVDVINDDNEPEVRITATTPAAAEPSTNGVFTVTRTGDTTAPLTVNYTVAGSATAGSDYTALPGTVTILAGAASATITVVVTDDAVAEGPETVIVTLVPSGSSYTLMNPTVATVTITDDDVAGFQVSFISNHTSENGATATFTVRLTSQPTASVSIPVASSNTAEGTVSTSSLTFLTGNWSVLQTVTVTGVNDVATDGNVNYQIDLGATSSSDPNYNLKNPAPVAVVNDDNEPELTILATIPAAAEPGTNGEFTVYRTGDTGLALVVNYTVSGTATPGADYTALPGTVTIPAGQLSAKIGLLVVNDALVELQETAIVTLTPAPGVYTLMTPSAATVTIDDNDVAGFTLTPITGHTTEGGGTATFTVVLNTQPTADVTIPLLSSNTAEGTVSPSSLVFTSANWSSPRTVTVTGVNDAATDGDILYQISLGPTSSADSDYNGKLPTPVQVTNDDNEPEVRITATTPAAAEPNVDGVFTVTRTGDTGAPLTVQYSVAGTAGPGVDYTALSGTVIIPAGAASATITVAVIDDDVAEGPETVIATLTPAPGVYTVMPPSTATVTIADDEAATILVSAISGNTSENGGAATFTVTLSSKPTANVTIPVTTSNTAEGVVSSLGSPTPGPTLDLVFTNADWNIAQTVTVTGVNDFVTDPSTAYQINLGPTSSTDTNYDAKTPPAVGVINDDNEPEVKVVATSPNAAEPNVDGTFTVSRTGDVSAGLTVNYTVGGSATAGSDYTGLSGSVTFLPGSATAIITVAVLDDALVEPAESVIVTLTPSANYTVANPSTATVTIADNDAVGFQVSLISNHTSENGASATFTVRLTSQPTADVTIPVLSSDTGEGTVSTASLVFTNGNWNSNQTVTVTGVNDFNTDPLHAYQITLGPTSSTDLSYQGLVPPAVAVINDDNEPEVSIVATTPGASEPGTNGVFTVSRTGSVAADLIVNYSVAGTATPGADYAALSGTVTIPAGFPTATITVAVIDDPIVEGPETVLLTLIPGAYTVTSPSAATVTITDDDTAGFIVSAISGPTTEGGGAATFTVRLSSQPTADVTIPLSSSNTAEGTVLPNSLVFTTADWSSPKLVTVTGVNDAVTDGNILYNINLGPTASADANYQGKTPAPVAVTNNDNEPEVSIAATSPSAAEPSTNGVFTVSRTGDTTATLVVNYTIGGTATAGSDYTALPGTVTIPAGSASATLTVAVIDDVVVESPETVILTLSAGGYTITSPSTATVTITDDDSAGFLVSSISGHTTESGGSATFTVRLTSQPTANVTISLSSSNTAEGTVFPTSLVFTNADWNTPKLVTVTGVNDANTDGNVAYQITLGAAVSGDANYSGKTPAAVAVVNDDNEPEVWIVATTPNASEPNVNGLFTMTRTGSTAAALTVNYSVGGTATGGSDYTALSGSVTIPAGAATATIPVQVVDDGIVEPAETVILTVTASASYTSVNPSIATVTIADDDVSGFAVNPTSGLITTESGGTATFTVRLTSVPSASVTVPVSSSNTGEGLVSSAGSPVAGPSLTLTFTNADWNVPQTVTVTGVNDAVTDGDAAYVITLGPTTSGDAGYNAKTPPAVSATNRDNEPEVSIDASVPGAAEPNTNGVFTITRTGSTVASLTVNYTVSGTATAGSDYTALGGSVVIPAGQASANVTVTILDDALVEPAETVILTLTPSPTYTVMSPSTATVTIADNDVAGITVRQIGTQTTESGGTATFTIVLDTVPAADVTISLTSSNTAEGTASPSTVTFTPANALTARTITVTGVADHVVDADKVYTIITNPAVSADLNYNGMDAADLSFTNKNTDVLGFSITPVAGLMTSEAGGTATFTVALTTVPTAVVTLPLTSNNILEGLISSAGSPVPSSTLTLTFTPGNALTPQTVTVTGVNDGAVDGNVAYKIVTGVASSSDSNYNGLNPVDVTVLNLDNDGPAITVNPISGLTTTEFGGVATFDVVLNQAPSADVTISLSSSNTAEGLISSVGSPTPGTSLSLTFTTATWNTPQTVTVTGVDDALSDGDIVYKILTAPASSTDPTYNGLNPPDVNVTNLDDEPLVPPQIGLNIGSLSFTASEGTVNPPPQSLAVTNIGHGSLNWSASVDVPWASELPGSGSVTTGADFITVSVDITGLSAGTYNGLLLVDAPGASNSPQTVGITLTVLPPAPTVQVTTPNTNPFTSPSNIVTLQGGSGGNATLISWSNAATGQTGTATGPVGAWSADIPLTAGDNPITVFAWNSGGAGISLLTVHYDPPDAVPPTLALTDPSSASTFSSASASITLSGPVSDNIGVSSVTWANLTTGTAGTANVTTVGGVTQWAAQLSLTNGSNAVQVVAKDDAGNSSSLTVTINYASPADGVPPQINILVPTTGDFWSAAVTPLPMGGTAFDPVGVTKVTWRNFNTGGRGVATGTTNWSCNVPLTLGGNFVAITAVDPSGNESTSTLLVSFKPSSGDKVSPFVMVLAPSQSPVLNLDTTSVSLGGAAADDVALDTVVWSNPSTGSSGTANGLASWSTSPIPLVQGVNVVTIAAYDTSGNKTEKQLFVVYTPPPPPPVHIKAGACGLTGVECLVALALAWGLHRRRRRSGNRGSR